MSENVLKASVKAGDSGPVIELSGEADLASAGQLSTLIDGLLSRGVRYLTIDVSGLSYADSATIRELLVAARTLHDRDGDLILMHPQRPLARLLELNGAGQLITIDGTGTATL